MERAGILLLKAALDIVGDKRQKLKSLQQLVRSTIRISHN